MALKITKEHQRYFIELTEYYQLLLEDEKTLNDIQNKILENEYRIKYLKEKKQNDDNKYIAIHLLLRFSWLGILGIILLCMNQC